MISDNALPSGRIELGFSERMNPFRVPGKTIQGHPDPVFRKQVGNVLEKNIEMTGEKTGLGSGGLAKKIVYAPDADGIITVKSKRRSIGSNACPPQITGRVAKPAVSIAQQTVKALDHADRK